MLNTLFYKNKEVKSRLSRSFQEFFSGKKQIFLITAVVLLQMKRSAIPLVPIFSGIFIGTAFYLLPTISYSQKIAGGGYHSLAVCGDSNGLGKK